MDYFYVILTVAITIILLIQVAMRKKYDEEKVLYNLKSSGLPNILFVCLIALLIFIIIDAALEMFHSEFKMEDGLQLVFWMMMLISQMLNQTIKYIILEEGITSIAFGNRIVKNYSWADIPGASESKKDRINFNVTSGKSVHTLTGKLGENKSSIIEFLKGKMVIESK